MEERKQYLQLLAFSTGPALEVVQNCFECKVLNNGSLEQFLNDPGNKHRLFHEYVPNIACCECFKTISIAAPSKRGCLNRSQFYLMYDDSGAVVPGHGKKHGKLRECLCKVSAKHSTEVTDFDIPILHAIINSCCPTLLNIRLIKDLKDVRNDLSHVGAGQIEKGNFNTYWSKLEQTTLGIAMEIGVTCVKMFKREISHLKTSSMEELKTLIESSKVDVDELLHHVPNGVKPILEIVGKMGEDIAMLKESQKNQSDLETHRHEELHTLIGETKEEIGKLKALLRIKENHDRKETAAKNENQNVDLEIKLESSALDERKTLQRLPELQENKPKEEFQLVEGEGKCILLKMRADPHIFSSEEILRKAILSLIRKIIQANEIDTSEENTLNVSLTFMSPLTNEQKRIVCSMISRNEFLNKQEFTDAEESRTDYTVKAETSLLIEKPEADKEELPTELIKKQEADQEELQTDVRKKPGAVKEELQTNVINLSSETDDKIKFRLKIMGFSKMEETEHSALVNTGDEIWDVAWNWSLSSHYKVDKIVSILKDNLSAFKNYWFEIDVVKNNIFDQLILHTTTQRQAFTSRFEFDAAVNSFINKLVELCALKDETEGKKKEIEIRIAIRSSLTKYTEKPPGKSSDNYESNDETTGEPPEKRTKTDNVDKEEDLEGQRKSDKAGITLHQNTLSRLEAEYDAIKHSIFKAEGFCKMIGGNKYLTAPPSDRHIKEMAQFYNVKKFLDQTRIQKLTRQRLIRSFKHIYSYKELIKPDAVSDLSFLDVDYKSVDVKCRLCGTENKQDITSFCVTCKDILCTTCLLQHKRGNNNHDYKYDIDICCGFKKSKSWEIDEKTYDIQYLTSQAIVTLARETFFGTRYSLRTFNVNGNLVSSMDIMDNHYFTYMNIAVVNSDIIAISSNAQHLGIANLQSKTIDDKTVNETMTGAIIYLNGQLYVACKDRVLVLDSNGEWIGSISIPKVKLLYPAGNEEIHCIHEEHSGGFKMSRLNATSYSMISSDDFPLKPRAMAIDEFGNILFTHDGVVWKSSKDLTDLKIIISSSRGAQIEKLCFDQRTKGLTVSEKNSEYFSGYIFSVYNLCSD